MSDAIVRARGLRKSYGALVAVAGIDFEVRPSECYGFLGPNGAGKTSTMKMVQAFSPRSGGDLSVLGLDPERHARQLKRRLGVAPQEDNLDPDLTVIENLLVYASYFGMRRAEALAAAAPLLDFLALTDKRDVRIPELSGGMKRRLVLARALINGPELLLLDEPTTGLDPQARHLIWQRLRSLKARGATRGMILTTHYMDEAAQLCDRLCIMDGGRILTEGSVRELLERHVTPEVVELRLGPDGDGADRATALLSDAGRLERAGDTLYVYASDGAAIVRRIESDLKMVVLRRPANLEDVFLRLTGRELRE